MSDIVVAVVGAVIGAGAATVGTYALYVKQRADSRRDLEARVKESGLQDQQQAARELFQCAYAAKGWLSGLPALIGASDAPARRDEIREAAMERMNRCHEVWDFSHMKVDSADVQAAMGELDRQLSEVLYTVVQGDLSPDLTALNQGLKALKDVANRRLDTRI